MKIFNKLFTLVCLICVFGMLNITSVNAVQVKGVDGAGGGDSVEVTTDPDADNTELSTAEHVGDNICSEKSVKNVIKLFGWVMYILKIFVPMILIGRGMMIFYKAVVSDNDKDLKASAIEFGKKIALGILVFFIPTLIGVLFDAYANFSTVATEYADCKKCLITPSNC